MLTWESIIDGFHRKREDLGTIVLHCFLLYLWSLMMAERKKEETPSSIVDHKEEEKAREDESQRSFQHFP